MGQLITETGTLIKDYIWNEMPPVEQIDAVIPAQAGIQSIETITYLYTDHLMIARLATNNNGIITCRWEGEAFGNTPAQELGTVSVNLRFPGQYYDSETNLHYNWHCYDPALGRYITSDPIGLAGGMNTYQYAELNSLRYIDPLGLCGCSGKKGYPSQTSVVQVATKAANYYSKKNNVEYCGNVCRDEDSGEYFTIGPFGMTMASCSPLQVSCPLDFLI